MDLTHTLHVTPHQPPDLESVTDRAAVLVIEFHEGLPYLCCTANLKRRLARLLRRASEPGKASVSRLLESVRGVSYQLTGSAFESSVLQYWLARRYRPDSYRDYLKLRPAPFVKVHLGNPYPRTYITTRLTGRRALFFGPFVNRASAERFEEAFLDLYKIRRCRENLDPHPQHPGCIYGEMDMCLRPCQARATREEYGAEVGRVLEFLESGGQSLVRQVEDAREQASTELQFEDAARHHGRLEKVHEALKLRDELARDIESFFGLVIQPSVTQQAVDLWLIYKGFLQSSVTFSLASEAGRPVSLDRRLREALEQVETRTAHVQERADNLALLNRWYRSSWKTGELVMFDGLERIPYRRVVNAVSRVSSSQRRASS